MGVDISSVNSSFRNWATKCDVNNDGKLDDNELSIFNKGKENYKVGGTITATEGGKNTVLRQSDGVTVDGVQFEVNNIDKFQRNQDGKYENTVRFNSGVTLDYNKQIGDAPASANSTQGAFGTSTKVSGLNNPAGSRVSGSNQADSVFIDRSQTIYNNNDGRDTVNFRY